MFVQYCASPLERFPFLEKASTSLCLHFYLINQTANIYKKNPLQEEIICIWNQWWASGWKAFPCISDNYNNPLVSPLMTYLGALAIHTVWTLGPNRSWNHRKGICCLLFISHHFNLFVFSLPNIPWTPASPCLWCIPEVALLILRAT
jgi:hypothetical protein